VLKEWGQQNRSPSEIKRMSERDRWRAEWVRKRKSLNNRSEGREVDEQEVDSREREREREREKRGGDRVGEIEREQARCTGKRGQRAPSCPITSTPHWPTAISTSMTGYNRVCVCACVCVCVCVCVCASESVHAYVSAHFSSLHMPVYLQIHRVRACMRMGECICVSA